MLCIRGVGLYTTKVTFDNGVQNIDISSEYIESFADLWANSGRIYSNAGQGGPIDGQLFVSAINLMAVFDSLVTLLGGDFKSYLSLVYIGGFLMTSWQPGIEIDAIFPGR